MSPNASPVKHSEKATLASFGGLKEFEDVKILNGDSKFFYPNDEEEKK